MAQEAVPPLGLAYVAAAARAAGWHVTVVDAVGEALETYALATDSPKTLIRGLDKDAILARIPQQAQVIGVSCMFSNAWVQTRALILALRLARPDVLLVLGGEHATAFHRDILATLPAVDAIVLGEGEAVLVDLLLALADGRSLRSVPGLAVREGAELFGCDEPNVAVPSIDRRRRIRDLAHIARPAWDLFPLDAYISGNYNHGLVRGRTMPILASRGCPYQCAFCSSPQMWTTRWEARDPDDVLDEMAHWQRIYAVEDFAFYDLTAIVKRAWILTFCQKLLARRLNVTWQLPSGTRTEALDAEVCRLLFASGCRNLNYAPESGSPRVLERIRKQVNIARLLGSMQSAVGAGLEVKVNIILGFPGETLTDVLQTYRFIVRCALLGAEAVSIFPFCPYPGSELFEQLRASGKVAMDDAYFRSLVYTDMGHVVSWNDVFSSAELRALVFVGNALFFGTQFVAHPQRFQALVGSLRARDQKSKVANAIEPMRKRMAVYKQIVRRANAHGARDPEARRT